MFRLLTAISLMATLMACRRNDTPSDTSTTTALVTTTVAQVAVPAAHDHAHGHAGKAEAGGCDGHAAGAPCGCGGHDDGGAHPGEAEHAHAAQANRVDDGKLDPWEATSGQYGCGACGHHAGADSTAVKQPGAKVGERAYCPTSGAAFEITATSPHRAVGKDTLYFCCEGCATHFSSHEKEILAARGIAR